MRQKNIRGYLLVGSQLVLAGGAFGADTSDPNEIGEIVVTAQRREQSLQDVPITVSAISGAAAQSAGVSGTQDLSMLVPGLNYRTTIGNANPFLRGVGTGATGSGNESPVATYVDGVYIPSMPGALMSLSNVERVEVIKGPQGTLFGRNATGGVIQVITSQPSSTPGGSLSVGYGNFDTTNIEGYVTGPLAKDLAANLAIHYNNQGDGWGRNLATGQDINKIRDFAARSKMVYDINDDSNITAIFDYSRTQGTVGVALRTLDGTLPITRIPFTGGFYDIDADHQPDLDTKTGGVSIQARIGLENMQLVSITSYRELHSTQEFDQDATPAPAVNLDLDEVGHDYTQEFQLLSTSGGRLEWVAGLFYFNQLAGYEPLSVFGAGLAPLAYVNTFDEQKTNSAALYGQTTYSFSDQTRLTTGLRYTYDWRRFGGFSNSNFGPVIPETVQHSDVGEPSWKLSLDHRFNSDTLVFASYNRGFKSGTFNAGGGGLTSPALDPEQLDAFEVGVKTGRGRIQVDSSVFYYNYRNVQIIRTDSGIQQLLNANARLYGIDLDAVAKITDGLTARAGIEAIHGTYQEFHPYAVYTTPLPSGGNSQAPGSGVGKDTVQTPPVSLNASLDYEVQVGFARLGFNVSYAFNDGWYADPDNRIRASAYSLVNAQMRLIPNTSNLEFTLWGKNLSNTHYFLDINESTLGDIGAVGAPRTYGASATWRF